MKITDILTDYYDYRESSFFSNDFDELEKELKALINEINIFIDDVDLLSQIMVNFCSDYCAYDMEDFDGFFAHCMPSELLEKLWLEEFNPRDMYFSFNEIWGVYSGNEISDFEELNELNETLKKVNSIASAVLDYINGEYFEGVEHVEGVEGETLRRFAQWLEFYHEGLHEDDNDYSAAVMAQL